MGDTRRRRLRRLAVATSAAAAILLALSVAAGASSAASDPPATLILQQSLDGHVQCVSPDATCTIVNLYGQNGDPGVSFIAPGQQHTTTVDLRNAGTLTASSLTVAAGQCTTQLCDTVTVSFLCTTGGTTFTFGPATFNAFGASGTHTINSGMPPGASTTCTFTTAYPLGAPALVAARSVQPVTWTLTAAEVPPATTTPTTTPASVAPTPPGAAPSPVAPPSHAPPPAALAFTGTDALAFAIAGLVLLAIGATLFRLSRRHDHNDNPT